MHERPRTEATPESAGDGAGAAVSTVVDRCATEVVVSLELAETRDEGQPLEVAAMIVVSAGSDDRDSTTVELQASAEQASAEQASDEQATTWQQCRAYKNRGLTTCHSERVRIISVVGSIIGTREGRNVRERVNCKWFAVYLPRERRHS